MQFFVSESGKAELVQMCLWQKKKEETTPDFPLSKSRWHPAQVRELTHYTIKWYSAYLMSAEPYFLFIFVYNESNFQLIQCDLIHCFNKKGNKLCIFFLRKKNQGNHQIHVLYQNLINLWVDIESLKRFILENI